ncbi:MAG: Thiamine-phosphate synthase [Planctomycetota bacterium]
MLHGRLSGFTPAAERTVQWCRGLLVSATSANERAALMILALLHDESLASACLRDFGVDLGWLQSRWAGSAVDAVLQRGLPTRLESEGSGCGPQRSLSLQEDPSDFQGILGRAKELARRETSDHAITSSLLLLAVIDQNSLIAGQLAAAGATREAVCGRLFPEQSAVMERLTVEEPLSLDSGLTFATTATPGRDRPLQPVLRAIDACLNRAREGLRVLEDCARFICNAPSVCGELKSLRHELAGAESLLRSSLAASFEEASLLQARDTPGDVGTALTDVRERSRDSLQELILANARRVQESLRSLEEFGKLLQPEFAAVMKQLRYRSYTAEQRLCELGAGLGEAVVSGQRKTVASAAVERLARAQIYVLITESQCRLPWYQVAEQALQGGADILQLREKTLPDREVLRRATQLAALCRSYGALCIVNDRAEIALAAGAHGVHVGQDEIPAEVIRRLPGWTGLIGVSTHSPDQFQAAFAAGADYAGVGPVFQSSTKGFGEFPGLPYVQAAASAGEGPWFAIGGISELRLPELLAAGARRIAVTAAVTQTDDPLNAVRRLRELLPPIP